MNQKDSLGDRMKGYENIFRHSLPSRMPVIIRLDGRAFHTYTKKCKKPFDQDLIDLMNDTAIYCCKNIQGAQIAYVQSDEISILLHNYKTYTTQPFLNNNIQKITSISAAMASAWFTLHSNRIDAFDNKNQLATFDSRVFILSEIEVNNYFLWRQKDMIRNSIQMLAHSLFSHKELDNKATAELINMILTKKNDWSKLPTSQQRGRCIVKVEKTVNDTQRSYWEVDNEIPIFSDNINYIQKLLEVKEPLVLTHSLIGEIKNHDKT